MASLFYIIITMLNDLLVQVHRGSCFNKARVVLFMSITQALIYDDTLKAGNNGERHTIVLKQTENN